MFSNNKLMEWEQKMDKLEKYVHRFGDEFKVKMIFFLLQLKMYCVSSTYASVIGGTKFPFNEIYKCTWMLKSLEG